MTKVRQLGHVSLTVEDMDRALAFYCDGLGMTLTERRDYRADSSSPLLEAAWIRCGSEHHSVALFLMRDADLRPVADSGHDSIPGMHHLAFELASFEDLAALHGKLVAMDVVVVSQRQFGPGSHVRLYCLDPDGHRVELYWELDTIGWDGAVREAPRGEEIDLQNLDPAAFLSRKHAAAASKA